MEDRCQSRCSATPTMTRQLPPRLPKPRLRLRCSRCWLAIKSSRSGNRAVWNRYIDRAASSRRDELGHQLRPRLVAVVSAVRNAEARATSLRRTTRYTEVEWKTGGKNGRRGQCESEQ